MASDYDMQFSQGFIDAIIDTVKDTSTSAVEITRNLSSCSLASRPFLPRTGSHMFICSDIVSLNAKKISDIMLYVLRLPLSQLRPGLSPWSRHSQQKPVHWYHPSCGLLPIFPLFILSMFRVTTCRRLLDVLCSYPHQNITQHCLYRIDRFLPLFFLQLHQSGAHGFLHIFGMFYIGNFAAEEQAVNWVTHVLNRRQPSHCDCVSPPSCSVSCPLICYFLRYHSVPFVLR
ncbi:hypothetical protein EDD85DRAFT_254749 [Armillaria nabsnona]|nr:hypothetical protein EDD85DRAFT_254749 [Armillaria nabsnona]